MWEKYLKLPEFLRVSGNDVEKTLLGIGLKKGGKVLDIGCGYGRISSFLKDQGFDVTAIDKDDKMVESTKTLGIRSFSMDATNIKFKKDSFDLVVTDGLLEHFKNPDPILKEEKKVTKKYVVNFIPQDTKINRILEVIQRTPGVYWRTREYWIKKHKKYFKKVFTKKLLRLDVYVCEK